VLPIRGDVLVKKGQRVGPRDIVARTYMPGDVEPVNLANLLSLPPADVPECMLLREGERVKKGDALAQTRGIFGLFKNTYHSRHEGTIETISPITGQVILRGDPIPVQVDAYLAGDVVEVVEGEGVVVEAEVTFVQGIFGIGGEAHGRIVMAGLSHDQELTDDLVTSEMKDCVIVGGARMTDRAIKKARDVGAAAIVSGGMDDQDLKEFLGYDLGVAITGNEDVGLTVIVTEGFGEIAMAQRTYRLLQSRAGDAAAVNGATQIRAGVMRPEIIVPLTEADMARVPEPAHIQASVEVGMPVRIIRDPYFGLIGEVSALPAEPQTLGSGSRARVLEVKLDSGESVVVPRANVELIEG
jgi:hypothetical protein